MALDKIRIVSRKSNLALLQSAIVKKQLLTCNPNLNVEIIGISTSGDEMLTQPLHNIGGKGLFITELEQYLLTEKADIAVHSMKDMPVAMTDALKIGAILAREDPRDVLVCKDFKTIDTLPPGSIIGTSSLRRQAQVLAQNPHVITESLRGNVETRIEKLLAGKYTGIILAAAGLIRLGLTQWLQNPIDIAHMLPAVGQGAIGVQYRHADLPLKKLLDQINDPISAACVWAERGMNAELNGGCTAPIAGFATVEDGKLTLRGLVADLNGKSMLTNMQTGTLDAPLALRRAVGKQLIAAGALELIAKAKQQDW